MTYSVFRLSVSRVPAAGQVIVRPSILHLNLLGWRENEVGPPSEASRNRMLARQANFFALLEKYYPHHFRREQGENNGRRVRPALLRPLAPPADCLRASGSPSPQNTATMSEVPPTRMNQQIFKVKKKAAEGGYKLLKKKADALKVRVVRRGAARRQLDNNPPLDLD